MSVCKINLETLKKNLSIIGTSMCNKVKVWVLVL